MLAGNHGGKRQLVAWLEGQEVSVTCQKLVKEHTPVERMVCHGHQPHPDGSVRSSFQAGTALADDEVGNIGPCVQAIEIQADGKVVIGGIFTRVSGVSYAGMARLNRGWADRHYRKGKS